jgi:hypothetical protein
MKSFLQLFSGGLFLLVCVTAHAAGCTTQSRQDNSESAIRKLEKSWSKAYWTGDAAFLECLYAPGFQSADSRGKLHSKDEDIAGSRKNLGKPWKDGPNGYQVDILMFPHTAVATSFAANGTHGFRVTDIYEYDGRRWHAIFSQDTKY